MKNRFIIGLTGVKSSGKSTAAEHILTRLSQYNPRIVSFADKLKRTCSKITGQPLENFEKQELKERVFDKPEFLFTSQILTILKEFGINSACTDIPEKFSGVEYKSNRQLMQLIGTDMLRTYQDDIHLRALDSETGVLIIPDVRFENEAKYIDRAGGYILYIQNTGAESKLSENSHVSETEVLKVANSAHFTVKNDGKNIMLLREQLDDILFDIEYYIKQRM